MGQKQKIQYATKAENTIWGKSSKYMRRQLLEIRAGHTMNHYMVAAPGGGRPTSCCPLVFSALASACTFCFCPKFLFCVFYLFRFACFRPIFYFWDGWGKTCMFFSFPKSPQRLTCVLLSKASIRKTPDNYG